MTCDASVGPRPFGCTGEAGVRSDSTTPWVRTGRLWLRPCEPRDLDRVHELWTSPEILEFLFDGRRIFREEAQSIIDRSDRCFTERGYGIWLFFAAEEQEQPQLLAGFVGLLNDSPESPRLVFGTRPALRGRGYAVEASLEVLRHAFGVLGLPRVFADVDEPNQASISVLRKIGMKPTGRAIVAGRPLLYYEIACAL